MKRGVTFAVFHSVGNLPDDIERLSSFVSGRAKTGEISLRVRTFMPSGPVALFDESLSIIWRTSFSVIRGMLNS